VLAGQSLTRTDLRVPALAAVDLSGRRVEGSVSRGKHLLLRLGPDPRTGSGPVTLHSHLGMEGRWELTELGGGPAGDGAPSGRGARRSSPPHAVRAVLETAAHRAVGHSVQQLALVPTPREDRLVGHLGPDLLDPQWSP
ncbi:hypothetical protein GR239_37450, partial [Rhizobium leguminosarum]|uniref:DNA-formamidopyrimidine glycosylase family protein n=1 Tax=Rhizobium ruizarguesonis TaxID=2081791 RepID=UPI0013B83EEE